MPANTVPDARSGSSKKGDRQRWGDLWMEKVALSATSGAGGVFSWQNPLKVKVLVIRVLLNVTTAASAGVTVDVGTAANGTTSSDNLMDNAALDSTGAKDNIQDRGTNGTSRQRVDERGGATDFINASASAAPTNLVGSAYIFYIET